MKKQTALPSADHDQTEALLQGLIAECQSIIRDVVLPGIRETDDHGHRRYYIHSITDLVESATKLGDAIGGCAALSLSPKSVSASPWSGFRSSLPQKLRPEL